MAAGTIEAVSSQPNAPGIFDWVSSLLKCSSQPRSWLKPNRIFQQ